MKMSDLRKPDLKMPNFKMPSIKILDTKMILVIVGGLALHFIIAGGFIFQRGSARNSLNARLQTLQSKWDDEDKARKEQQENELQQKYGTNQLDRIAADPRKNIQMALQKMFKAVLDSECTVDVTVDRFTEFRVYVTTGNLPEPLKMAVPLQEVFSRIDPALVYEVVFTDGDRFWLFEAYQLQSIDWKTATPEQIVAACFPRK